MSGRDKMIYKRRRMMPSAGKSKGGAAKPKPAPAPAADAGLEGQPNLFGFGEGSLNEVVDAQAHAREQTLRRHAERKQVTLDILVLDFRAAPPHRLVQLAHWDDSALQALGGRRIERPAGYEFMRAAVPSGGWQWFLARTSGEVVRFTLEVCGLPGVAPLKLAHPGHTLIKP